MKKESRYTPYGNLVMTIDEYVKQWDDLIIPLQEKLNVRVFAYNPSISIENNDNPNATAQLPMWLAKKIIGWDK